MNIFRRIWEIRGKLIDPDRRWFSPDKWQHGGSFFAFGFFMSAIGRSLPDTLRDAAVIGIVYELGQTDVAFSQNLLGQPGYGISPLDITWDMAGALLGWCAGRLV